MVPDDMTLKAHELNEQRRWCEEHRNCTGCPRDTYCRCEDLRRQLQFMNERR